MPPIYNDEDCEVDLLSNSNYEIGVISIENDMKKGSKELAFNMKPVILIEKDVIANTNMSNFRKNTGNDLYSH